jgi:ABC-type Fe3+-hydroxamate transport system substrate-binding protein
MRRWSLALVALTLSVSACVSDEPLDEEPAGTTTTAVEDGLPFASTTTAAPTTTAVPTTTAPPPPPARAASCDPNYAGACVPPYPPDVDCGDVGQPVQVVGSDPHGLDRDADGAGCESS